jgi:20S proteasome subunit beta 2
MAGFDFSNHNRNAALHAQGVPLPKATSTGTTIVGALFDGGVVIAADTRATSGPIVADKVRLSIASSCTSSSCPIYSFELP